MVRTAEAARASRRMLRVLVFLVVIIFYRIIVSGEVVGLITGFS